MWRIPGGLELFSLCWVFDQVFWCDCLGSGGASQRAGGTVLSGATAWLCQYGLGSCSRSGDWERRLITRCLLARTSFLRVRSDSWCCANGDVVEIGVSHSGMLTSRRECFTERCDCGSSNGNIQSVVSVVFSCGRSHLVMSWREMGMELAGMVILGICSLGSAGPLDLIAMLDRMSLNPGVFFRWWENASVFEPYVEIMWSA